MAARDRYAALLAVLAVVLVANPMYVGLGFSGGGESRSPTAYTATPVDPTNESNHDLLVFAVGDDDVVDVDEFANANEYAPHGDEYRAPADAAAVLEDAVESGSAATSDADAAFTLRRVVAAHRYAAAGDDPRSYYRLDASTDGDAVTVTAANASRTELVDYLVHRDAVLYTGLPEHQRDAVDAAIDAGSLEYRPVQDDHLAALTDDVVVRDDAYYVVREAGHVDSFGPSMRDLVSLALTGLGWLAFLAAVVLLASSYVSARRN